MRIDKESAFKLRRSGKSYREIRTQLNVPLGTLSTWFSNEKWSKDIADTLSARRIEESKIEIIKLNRTRGIKLAESYKQGRISAKKEFRILKEEPVFIAGLVAYWGEGDKTSKYHVRLSNTDPGVISLFKGFLEQICNVPEDRITCWLLLYPDLNNEICKIYWSKETNIPLQNFRKSMYIKGRHPTKRLSYGVCNIVVSSRYLKEKILVWLSLINQEYSNASIV